MELSDEEFDRLITKAMEELPQEYIVNLNNVVVTYADEPSTEQLARQGIDENHILLGLYEGIPLTERGAGYQFVLPDKITLFKYPILAVSSDPATLFAQIKRTLWHEIAHHYGLNHHEIDNVSHDDS